MGVTNQAMLCFRGMKLIKYFQANIRDICRDLSDSPWRFQQLIKLFFASEKSLLLIWIDTLFPKYHKSH